MAAIVGGADLGLATTSGLVLGSKGQVNSAPEGRAGEGVTVNAVTGNLILQRQDELLVGRGPDSRIVRTYNSQGQLNDDNGDNWRLGFSRKVYEQTGTINTVDSTVTRVDEDGAEIKYTYDTARGMYITTKGAGAFDTLSYDTNSQQWAWTDGDTQIKEIYDNANGGRLTQVIDSDGNALSLAYNTDGLISVITTADGEQTLIDYDTTEGRTSNIVDIRTQYQDANNEPQTLTRVRYGYDGSNRLTTVTTDLSPEDNSITDGKTYITTYTYDGSSRRISGLEQSDGSRLNFTYTQDGTYRIKSVQDYRSATDIRTTTFAYDDANRKTLIADPLGQATVLSYDSAGQVLSIQSITTSGISQLTRWTYDAQGNVLSVSDGHNATVTYGYDANGNRILERDAQGNTITRSYGNRNELLSETTYTVPDTDGAGSIEPQGAQTANYLYDTDLHLRFKISSEGRVTEYRYNSQGQPISQIVYAGASYTETEKALGAVTAWATAQDLSRTQRTDTSYDFRGQISQVTTYATVDVSGNGVADGAQSITQYIYDQTGQLLQKIDPRKFNGPYSGAYAFMNIYTYDGLGRLLTNTDSNSYLTTYLYDDANRQTSITLANGLITTTTYDQAGLATAVVKSDSSGLLNTQQYAYDKLDRLVMETDAVGAKTLPHL